MLAQLLLLAAACPPVWAQSVEPAEGAANAKSWNGDHMLGVLPAYNVARGENFSPLTARQKFHLFVQGTSDPITFVAVGVQAGISQAKNANAGYGTGGEGFAKRYGAAWTDATSGRLFRNGVYPTLFHQDPRYFRATAQNGNRVLYAASRIAITRSDRNEQQFNWSKLCASLTSAGLSNLYYPSSNRGIGLTVTNIGISYGTEAGFNVLKEFWPDLQRRFSRRK